VSLTTALAAQALLAGLALLAALTGRARPRLAGIATVLLSAAGVATGALALGGATARVTLPLALPAGPYAELVLAPDRLGGVFVLVSGAVGVVACLHAAADARGSAGSRTQWAALVVFLVGLLVVPAAGDVVTFLLAWELMAGASTVLVLADHRRPAVRSAAQWYAVMTHLSMVAILAGFAVLASRAGSTDFAVLARLDPRAPGVGLAFGLLLLGFGAKAGLVPLHVWLPRAHPEAPSHVSALMSAAMVATGVYGLLLVTVRLLPGGPTWWAVALVVLGALSAVYGILQASVTSDLKRLLAYSTSENVGLAVLALGIGLLLGGADRPGPAAAALLACVLLVVAHAAFKATLFLASGSVLHATGERDLDRLGGLGHSMPWTAAGFGLAALGAAALPATGGFVAEWVLLQALIRGTGPGAGTVAVVTPLALAAVALTAGLALVTVVKAYGIAFLARPRSPGAAAAHEAPLGSRVAVGLGALAVLGLGLAPGPVAVALAPAVGIDGATGIGLGGLVLDGVGAVLDPVLLGALGLAVLAPVLIGTVVNARRRPAVADAPAWGCGQLRTDPRMQYTATSYAEPLTRVFDDALQPARDVEVTHVAESRYMAASVRYRQSLEDVVEVRLYRPLVRAAERCGEAARGLQNGSLHRYLGLAFGALLVVLVVVAR
jgi:formate hydrogenlyase subunit 3/multisubunit Na+/H+ antiporter MnhD subunit